MHSKAVAISAIMYVSDLRAEIQASRNSFNRGETCTTIRAHTQNGRYGDMEETQCSEVFGSVVGSYCSGDMSTEVNKMTQCGRINARKCADGHAATH